MIWFVLTLCLLLIMACVLLPFLKPAVPVPHTDWTRESLKAALAAADKDEARGVLSAAAANQQRRDIAGKAKAALDAESQTRTRAGRTGFIIAAVGLLLAPAVLFGGYWALGTPSPQPAQTIEPQITLEGAIAALEARLETTPDDAKLWASLGDLKIRNEDFVGAEAAFERAVGLPIENSEEAAQLWMILAMTRRTQGVELSDPKVVGPLEKSLALDENSPAAILLERIKDDAAQ